MTGLPERFYGALRVPTFPISAPPAIWQWAVCVVDRDSEFGVLGKIEERTQRVPQGVGSIDFPH